MTAAHLRYPGGAAQIEVIVAGARAARGEVLVFPSSIEKHVERGPTAGR